MLGEITSEGSVATDRTDKLGICARGQVPLMLLVDPLCEPGRVTIYSAPRNGRYAASAHVELGGELVIPDPVDTILDTGSSEEVTV